MISVSDHAIIRYLERVGGFDINQLRQQIGIRVSDAAKSGASAVLVDGFEFVIRRDESGKLVVTTVLDPSKQKRRHHR